MDLDDNPMSDAAKQAVLELMEQNDSDPVAAAARVTAAVGVVAVPAAEAALDSGSAADAVPGAALESAGAAARAAVAAPAAALWRSPQHLACRLRAHGGTEGQQSGRAAIAAEHSTD